MAFGDSPQKVVLLVEDDEATAELETRVLRRAGLAVRVVVRVADALAILERETFVAILLDYQLPDGDPWSVVKAAKSRTPPIPVIVVTAMGNERVAVEALHHGVTDYVKKSDTFWDTLPTTVERVVRLGEIEDRLHRTDAMFQLIANYASDTILVTRPDGTIKYASPACMRLYGFEPPELLGRSFFDLIEPGARPHIQSAQGNLRPGEHASSVFLAMRKDGSRVWVESSADALPADGSPDHDTVRVTRDVSVRKKQESALQATLKERELLLKEVHHRVKNNLQVIQSLLSIQCRALDEGPTLDAVQDTIQRVHAMALVHEKLYQSENLAAVSLPDFVEDLFQNLLKSSRGHRDIELRTDIAPLQVGLDVAVPLGLLLNELVSNSLKHAFPERHGTIQVGLRSDSDGIRVTVTDDGIGLPLGFDPASSASIGLRLASSLAKQLGGTLELQSRPGTRFAILIPEPVPA